MGFAGKIVDCGEYLGGWRRYALALLLGGMAALTLPPIYWYLLLVPAFSGLYILLNNASTGRQAFWTGWWFGLGYFAAGLYWLAYALLVEPEKFAWMIPFAVLGLPSILAIYYGVAAWMSGRIVMRSIWFKWAGFLVLWCGMEWLRGVLFTGFPWNYIGYSWTFSTVMIQPAWFVGIHGLNLWTMALATLPAMVILAEWDAVVKGENAQRYCRQWPLLGMLLLLILPFGYGVWRLCSHPTEYSDVIVRLVQANIAQGQKWDPQRRFEAIQTHVELSGQTGAEQVDMFIWPETAYPYVLQPSSPPLRHAVSMLENGQYLLTGAIRTEPDAQLPPEQWRYWNSVYALNRDAAVVSVFDKQRLVPFGEFVPFRSILPVEKITHGMQDFSRGEGEVLLPIQNLPMAAPLICYEAIFPTKALSDSAEWLLNVTNDAWFGVSSGPYQHLQMARMRAVESGLPLVRSANTGISVITDPYGRVVQRLGLGQQGVITAKLPLPTLNRVVR